MLPPVIRSRSLRLSGIASTLMRSSPGPGSGMGTTSSLSASSGCPYSWVRQARISPAVAIGSDTRATPPLECRRTPVYARVRSRRRPASRPVSANEYLWPPCFSWGLAARKDRIACLRRVAELDIQAFVDGPHNGHRVPKKVAEEDVHGLSRRHGAVSLAPRWLCQDRGRCRPPTRPRPPRSRRHRWPDDEVDRRAMPASRRPGVDLDGSERSAPRDTRGTWR